MKILDYIKNDPSEIKYIKYAKVGEKLTYHVKDNLNTDCLKKSILAYCNDEYYTLCNMTILKNCFLIFKLEMSPTDYGEACVDDYIIIDVIEDN